MQQSPELVMSLPLSPNTVLESDLYVMSARLDTIQDVSPELIDRAQQLGKECLEMALALSSQ